MKIRILANSFRFRLKQPEVASFQEKGLIEERVEFGAAVSEQLSFQLQVTEKETFSVSFSDGKVVFYLPASLTEEWMTTNRVGIQQEIDTPANRKIKLLVEKDFKCMDACEEDNAGSYHYPLQQA
jgi:hypothetical protein